MALERLKPNWMLVRQYEKGVRLYRDGRDRGLRGDPDGYAQSARGSDLSSSAGDELTRRRVPGWNYGVRNNSSLIEK